MVEADLHPSGPQSVDIDLVFPGDLPRQEPQFVLVEHLRQLILARSLSRQEIRLVGRVISVTSTGSNLTLVLADAIESHEVEGVCPMGFSPRPGDLLTLRVPLTTAPEIAQLCAGEYYSKGEFTRSAQGLGRRLNARANAKTVVREHMRSQGFLEVETPLRVKSPGTDIYIDPCEARDGWLITSPEFHMKRLLVGGMPRIYQFARCTRTEELGPWHEPEFTLLEWYRAFSGMESVLRDTENLVAIVAGALGVAQNSPLLQPPFDRLSVRDAFREYAGLSDAVALANTDEDAYFQLLVDKVEPGLKRRGRPVFLERFPAKHAALARLHTDDPTVAERFELYAQGVELCNGYGELTDPNQQRERFEHDRCQRSLRGQPDLPADEELLRALEEGMPPSGGNAVGFDRLVAICLEVSVPDVVAFPAGRG